MDSDAPTLAADVRALLKRLAKGPMKTVNSRLAAELVRLGLAVVDEAPRMTVITPKGRRCIAQSAARSPAKPPPGERPLIAHRRTVRTVADMQRAGWAVTSHCARCNARWPIDLDLMAWRRGARTVLWDERGVCLTLSCDGPVAYKAQPPGELLARPLIDARDAI